MLMVRIARKPITSQVTSGVDLVSAFNEYFRLIIADTDVLRNIGYKIRYQVYCEEMKYENPDDFPDQLEFDEYDANQSIHCLLQHKPSGLFAGCVRLVKSGPESDIQPFPFEKHCGINISTCIDTLGPVARSSLGEISRLAVISDFRRRKGETESPCGDLTPQGQKPDSRRTRFPSISLGLHLAVTAIGLHEGLEGVIAMMEPRLARMLRHSGIVFTQLGPIQDYHGPRAPFYINRNSLFNNIKPEMLALLSEIHHQLIGSPLTPSSHHIVS